MKSVLLTLFACAALVVAPAATAQTVAAEPPPSAPATEAPAATPPIAAASPPNASSNAEKAGQAKAAASADVLIPAAPPGRGQIVFFRPGRFAGAAVSWKLLDGATALGKIGNARYLVVTLEPGIHELVMDFGTKGSLRIEIDPDETYYVECGIAMGVLLNHPNLIPSTRDGFEAIAAKLKPAKVVKP